MCVFVYVYVCIYIYTIYIYIQYITEYVQTNQNQNWTESRACELESNWQICITHIHKHNLGFLASLMTYKRAKALLKGLQMRSLSLYYLSITALYLSIYSSVSHHHIQTIMC